MPDIAPPGRLHYKIARYLRFAPRPLRQVCPGPTISRPSPSYSLMGKKRRCGGKSSTYNGQIWTMIRSLLSLLLLLFLFLLLWWWWLLMLLSLFFFFFLSSLLSLLFFFFFLLLLSLLFFLLLLLLYGQMLAQLFGDLFWIHLVYIA